MHLTDKYGWPYEKRKGRPIHNFIRAIVLLLSGKLVVRIGQYKKRIELQSERDTEEKSNC